MARGRQPHRGREQPAGSSGGPLALCLCLVGTPPPPRVRWNTRLTRPSYRRKDDDDPAALRLDLRGRRAEGHRSAPNDGPRHCVVRPFRLTISAGGRAHLGGDRALRTIPTRLA